MSTKNQKKFNAGMSLGDLNQDVSSSTDLAAQSAKNAILEFFRISSLVVTDIAQLFTSQKIRLAVAESCTGGLLATAITKIEGASAYFNGGTIVYSDAMKISLLGVDESILEKYGAVSALTVCQMAAKVCELTNSQVGIAISGIAGPDGGTDKKPVGTVWIGLAIPKNLSQKKAKKAKIEGKTWQTACHTLHQAFIKRETPPLTIGDFETSAKEFCFQGDRESVRQSAVLCALYQLYNAV